MAQKPIDLAGVKVNMITFIEPAGRPGFWKARCECGRTIEVRHSNVRHCGQFSCGCSKKKHGMSTHPAYKAWNAMMARCYTPANKDYPNAGGKGIKVADRWHQFENFWKDMEHGWFKNAHLVRMDKASDYAEWNVVWAMPTQMARIRAPRRLVPSATGLASIREVSEQYGIPQSTIRSRIRRNWPPARIISPVDISKRNGRNRA